MITDCYLVRIMVTSLVCLHPEGKTQPDRQIHEKGKRQIKGDKKRDRGEIGKANTLCGCKEIQEMQRQVG